MYESQLTIIGNLVETPVLRVTQTGLPVTTIRLASTSRRYDRESGRWADGETFFMSVACWRQLAEHVCDSLEKGDRVVAVGRVRQRAWTTDDGSRRTTLELEGDAVGPELGRASVRIRRVVRQQAAADDVQPADLPDEIGKIEETDEIDPPQPTAPAVEGAPA